MPRAYLLPIADREPLAWIVREQRTAFGEHRACEASALEVGDVLFLYTTRGCFRNPTRDRGRVIGRAVVSAAAKRASSAFVGAVLATLPRAVVLPTSPPRIILRG